MNQRERDEHRRMVTGCRDSGGYLNGVISHAEVLALLDDADRCAELESLFHDSVVDGVLTVNRPGCAYCDWQADVVHTREEAQAGAAAHAKDCPAHPLGQRIAELEATPRFECWNCGKLNCDVGVCKECWHGDNPELDAALAEVERLESDLHQWDEWNAKAKVRYEEMEAENERLTRAFDLAANGCRRDAENHATEGNKLTAAYAAATARHLDSLLVGGEG